MSDETTVAMLSRPRLTKALTHVLTRRMTCVVAGAGFGKTTALRSWSADARCAWHSLTAADRNVGVLARGILDELTECIPGLSAWLAGTIGEAGLPDNDDDGRAGAIAALVCDALHTRLRDDVVIVLDDTQLLAPGSGSARFVEFLCRQAPDRLHVVLSGREEPPFHLERLRAHGDVLDLSANDLAFTVDETAELLASVVRREPGELAPTLWDATRGWPVAVRLAADMMAEASPADQERIVEGVRLAEGPLFDYLARDVFDREPFVVRELVRTAAACGQISAQLCEALGQPETAGHINSLLRRGLLVEHRAAGRRAGSAFARYSLVPLAREFALRHFPLDQWELRELSERAAAWFVEQNDLEVALNLLLDADLPNRVVDLLADHGSELLGRGAVAAVIRAADSVPADALRPAHWRLLGEALQVRGDWERALSCFRRVETSLGELDTGLAWRMGVIHYLRGDLDDALEVYRRGLVTTSGDSSSSAEDARLLAWMATAYWAKGDASTCRELTDRAMRVATNAADDRALAAVHTTIAMLAVLEGDRAANDQHYATALEHAERAGDVLQIIRIRVNHASHCQDEGNYEDALAELEAAIPLADLAGFATFQALGRNNRGDAYRCLGRFEEAIVDFEAAKLYFQRTGSRDVCYPICGLGDVYLARGDLALARSAYEQAVTLAEDGPELQNLVPALSGLARVLASDDPAAAGKAAERALSFGPVFGHVGALLAAARVALLSAELTRADDLATQAASEARRQRDRASLAEALEIQAHCADSPYLLEQAAGSWRDLRDPIGTLRVSLLLAGQLGGTSGRELAEDVARQAAQLGAHGYSRAAADLLASFECKPQPKLAIRVLGTFTVLRNGVSVTAATWQSKKARDLLKILVSRRGRPVARLALMAALWPDQPPERLSNRLSVALSTVRGVLDPDKELGPAPLIDADLENVRLDISQLTIDVESFLADASTGLAHWRAGRTSEAGRLLAAAETTYTGDFLDENPYDDWATALREEAKAAYLEVLRALADEAAAAGDNGTVARYQLRILEHDPYDERAHLDLVHVLERTGSHGEARRRYQAYLERMAEIDAEAAPFPKP
ncbi:BTAD domain-containing putative transcriptional regulator [Kribbella yunnanensis]|uniref:BTAD domain-containing putative transcriptional regulator n=1 Tax=Kribbella yunnanensis TaxID=190194 RepID=A0ABN2IUW6_9ACTN